MIPTRELAPGVAVPVIGFGGYHLGMIEHEREAIRLLHAAIDAGITFLDNAWEYNDHVSEERMGKALASGNRRDQVFLMTKLCSHGRGYDVAMQQLEESLRRLRTDHRARARDQGARDEVDVRRPLDREGRRRPG